MRNEKGLFSKVNSATIIIKQSTSALNEMMPKISLILIFNRIQDRHIIGFMLVCTNLCWRV